MTGRTSQSGRGAVVAAEADGESVGERTTGSLGTAFSLHNFDLTVEGTNTEVFGDERSNPGENLFIKDIDQTLLHAEAEYLALGIDKADMEGIDFRNVGEYFGDGVGAGTFGNNASGLCFALGDKANNPTAKHSSAALSTNAPLPANSLVRETNEGNEDLEATSRTSLSTSMTERQKQRNELPLAPVLPFILPKGTLPDPPKYTPVEKNEKARYRKKRHSSTQTCCDKEPNGSSRSFRQESFAPLPVFSERWLAVSVTQQATANEKEDSGQH